MSIEAIKGAFINRSRSVISLMSGQLKIYSFATIAYPNNKTEIIRSVLFPDYVDNKCQMKKPYRIFMVSFTIPVLLLQNGFFIMRKVNCVFALYDGKDMREDITNTLKSLRGYRSQVIIAALALATLGGFTFLLGGAWQFLSFFLIGWFGTVALIAILLRVDDLQADMEELIDLDRNHWDVPPPIEKKGDSAQKVLATRFEAQSLDSANEEKPPLP